MSNLFSRIAHMYIYIFIYVYISKFIYICIDYFISFFFSSSCSKPMFTQNAGQWGPSSILPALLALSFSLFDMLSRQFLSLNPFLNPFPPRMLDNEIPQLSCLHYSLFWMLSRQFSRREDMFTKGWTTLPVLKLSGPLATSSLLPSQVIYTHIHTHTHKHTHTHCVPTTLHSEN